MNERRESFLQAAVERGWITKEQADECRRVAETVAEVGLDQKIEDIAVKKGFLTPEQARQISRQLSKMKVGKYQILEKVGEGGAGIVYKANQEPLERLVAIKVLSSQRTESPRYLERFLREARIAVTLNHKNIVRGLDYGESDGYHYFVMEFVKGESLFALLEREGTLSEKRALEIVLQIVEALEYASRYDLVHRDIKPENILLTEDGVAKLCDLGLAKPSLVETARTSRDGTTIGTPTYMSPEQIRGKDDTDFRSDIYSLGATLYHMVTGRPPFTGESADIVVRRHLREPATDPRELNLSLSSSTAAIILKMLAKKPEDRYPSLHALREDISAVLDGRPPTHTIELGKKRPSGTVHVEIEDAPGRRARIVESHPRSRTPLFLALAVLILGGGLVVVLRPFAKKEPPEEPKTSVAEPSTPREPTPEEKAEELYRETADWMTAHADASFEEKKARWRAVATRYPETRWALQAGEQVAALIREREAALRRHREQAKALYDQALDRALELVRENRYGDAIRELHVFPSGYEDTGYPEKAKKEAERLAAEAKAAYAKALEQAELDRAAARFAEARARLEPFLAYGLVDLEKSAREKLAEIEKEREAVTAARERGRLAFRAAVGKALLRVAAGEISEARNDLVEAQGEESLVWFQDDLSRMDGYLLEAARFREALAEGAKEIVGKVQRLRLREGKDAEVAGKVLSVLPDGLRISRSGGSRQVPFSDLAGDEQVRLAFFALDMDAAADHQAAAIHLIAAGLFSDADREIEAARILGADNEGILGLKELFVAYLRDLAEAFVRKATLRMTQDRPEEAKEQLEQAIARAPWYGRPHLLMGQVQLRLDKPEKAVEELKRALELKETDPQVHYYLGEAYFRLDRAADALAAYSKFADLSESNGDRLERVRTRINELRARALAERIETLTAEARKAQRQRDWEKVIRIYEKIRELDPDDPDPLYHLGKAHLERREILLAYARLKEFLARRPGGRQASDARKLTRHLMKTYRSSADTEGHVADANQQLGANRLDNALSLCDLALKDAPLNEDAHYTRALVHLKIGQVREDEEAFRACLEDLKAVEVLNEEQPLVSECRALALFYLKRYEEALKEAERAMTVLPNRWQSYNVAGLIHHEQGRDEKAIEVLTRGIEKAPGEVLLYLNRALTWESLRRWEKAIADINTARKCNPTPGQLSQLDRIFERVVEARRRDER